MNYIIIILLIYGTLFIADIIQAIMKMQWKALKFSIPIYILTLTANIMIGLGFQLISPNDVITKLVSLIK